VPKVAFTPRHLLKEFQYRKTYGTCTRDFGNSFKIPVEVFLARIAEH
jgi:hypothetical protein